MSVKSLADGATKLFPMWSVLVGFLALYEPSIFLWYGKEAISVGLGIIMLGMGMTLSVEDFAEVLKKPKLVALGALLQFSIMPAWAAFIAFIFKVPAEMAVGLILVASCPGGTASNVVVFLAGGRVALSVCLTACSTLLAIVVTPWLTHYYAGHYLPIDPWALMKSIFYIVLIPLIVGVSWKKFYPKTALRASVFPSAFRFVYSFNCWICSCSEKRNYFEALADYVDVRCSFTSWRFFSRLCDTPID